MRFGTRIISIMSVVFCLLATPVFAHTLWITTESVKSGEDAVVILGYSDDFPQSEPIDPERRGIFKAPEMFTSDGKAIALKPSTDSNYKYTTSEPLEQGTYLLCCQYQPTFWTKTETDGYKMVSKDKANGPVVTSYRYGSFAKGIVNVRDTAETGEITKPTGTLLEIVPQVNPGTLRVGERMCVQVLYEGKPLSKATVTGMTGEYGEGLHDIKAFSNKTDKDGYVDFVPWKAGLWQLEIDKIVDTPDSPTHDFDHWRAHLCFEIK